MGHDRIEARTPELKWIASDSEVPGGALTMFKPVVSLTRCTSGGGIASVAGAFDDGEPDV